MKTKNLKIKNLKTLILFVFIFFFVLISFSNSQQTDLLAKKEDFSNLRLLIEKLNPDMLNLSLKGTNVSLRYSTEEFPSIYQGGFTLANQVTILSLNPILKFFYDYNYDESKTIENYKDILILSSNYLEYKNRKYRGKFSIVRKNDGFYLINLVDMDSYLKSVVPSEMPSSWEIEALKAQAIAARTYAVKVTLERRKKREVFDLYSTVLDQAYYGMDKETPKTNLAVEQTKDLIISYNGQPIWALYHSNCGGKTIQGNLVFPNRLKPEDNYLVSKECPYQGKEWQTKIEFYTLKKILQKLTKNQVYSIDNIYVNNFKTYIVYNKEMVYSIYNWEIRKLVGYNIIRSPYITNISVNDESIWIKGAGFGHGVGLCQFGANTLAKNGFNYKEILLHYYQNIEIVKIDEILR